MSDVTCRLSPVACHLSPVTCHQIFLLIFVSIFFLVLTLIPFKVNVSTQFYLLTQLTTGILNRKHIIQIKLIFSKIYPKHIKNLLIYNYTRQHHFIIPKLTVQSLKLIKDFLRKINSYSVNLSHLYVISFQIERSQPLHIIQQYDQNTNIPHFLSPQAYQSLTNRKLPNKYYQKLFKKNAR